MIRVRHYTTVSGVQRILDDGVIKAFDQNKVFVEKADNRRLSPTGALEKYGLARGRGNACIEFEIEQELLRMQYNVAMEISEYYLQGDVVLAGREVEAFFNFAR